jgi:hypothetical protein
MAIRGKNMRIDSFVSAILDPCLAPALNLMYNLFVDMAWPM